MEDPYSHPYLCEPAMTALGAIGGSESEALLKAAVRNPDERMREYAAKALCRMGSREGVNLILRSDGDLFPLNALRAPQAWNRLARMTVTGDLVGTTQDKVERLASEAGMKLEWLREGKAARGDWSLRVPNQGARLSVLRALEKSLSWHAAVLEEDRIRVLAAEEGLAFWRAWWEREEARQRK